MSNIMIIVLPAEAVCSAAGLATAAAAKRPSTRRREKSLADAMVSNGRARTTF